MLDMEAEEQTYRQDSPIENHRGPLNLWIGGQNRDGPTVGQYLTRGQTKYIYKK